FHMKHLLSLADEDIKDIFTISYCFRDEPQSPIHRHQFLMLEWYRKNVRYESIMKDVEALISHCLKTLDFDFKKSLVSSKMQKVTVQEIFYEFCKIDILNYLDKKELIQLLKKDFKDVPLPSIECDWED